MGARYSVNGRPPYFAKLNEARAHSMLSDAHGPVDGDLAVHIPHEWCDTIYCNEEVAGKVVRVTEYDEVRSTSWFRWVDVKKRSVRGVFADGSLEHVNTDAATVRPKLMGQYYISNGTNDAWFETLEDNRAYILSAVLHLELEPPPCGEIKTLYRIRAKDGSTVEYAIHLHEGTVLFGSADKGWWHVRENGKLDRKTPYIGGPALDGTTSEVRNSGRDVKAAIAMLKKDLREKLTDEEYEKLEEIIASRDKVDEDGLMECLMFAQQVRGRMEQDRRRNRENSRRRRGRR